MDKHRKYINDILLLRFVERRASLEECRDVFAWIESSEENRIYFKHFQSLWAGLQMETSTLSETDRKSIDQILKMISKKRKRVNIYRSLIAAAVLFLFFSLGHFYVLKDTIDYEPLLKEIAGQQEITLMINSKDKKTITVPDSAAVLTYSPIGSIIINDSVKVEEKSTLNVIRVPFGKRSTIYLSDGTKVYLNSGSSFIYPSVFDKKEREVYLEGEAFFEVCKADGKLFKVKTAYRTVEVLGTRFNVSVDKQRGNFETVLVDGKIALDGESKKIELVPSQRYLFSDYDKHEKIERVNVEYYISWIEGTLLFDRRPLSEVLYKLEKVYDIDIRLLKPEYKDYLISGSLNLQNTAEESLDAVMYILTSNYDPKGQPFYRINKKN